jgi:hypothetical protein
MPVDFQITQDGWLTRLTITEPWSVEDLLKNFDMGRELRDNSPHKVYTLLDLRGVTSAPPNLLRLRSSPIFAHPNSGYAAVVGANAVARNIIEVFLKVLRRKHVGFFTTETEAMVHLNRLIEAERESA